MVIDMQEVPVNYIAILTAGIVNMLIGFLWYSPFLFGNTWMKLSGFTKENMNKAKKDMNKLYLISFLATLIMAFVLSHYTIYASKYYNMQGMMVGITAAFWSWIGFIMPVQLTGWIFDKKPFKLFLINTGYQLVAIIAMGTIIGVWK
jgi:hypothetical protein